MDYFEQERNDAGRRHREQAARRSREQSESVADIGEMPAVENPVRREACRYDLKLFLETYFPASTGLKPFSDDHARVIASMQDCVLSGGRHVNGVYRGFAKTTISENTAIWATLFGHRGFVPVFGADQSAAAGIIDSIKRELDSNDLLLADFPEVCFPIRCLEGKPQRQFSQTYRGELTHIRWTADTIVLPTIAGSQASGAILCAHGITGSNRGMKFKRPSGEQKRPDFVIIDDFQTDESANSPLQVRKRLDTIRKTILRLGGHNKTIACVVNGTVICIDDGMDQLLDASKNPAWRSMRIAMIKEWATEHETLWLKDYAEARNTYDPTDPESQRDAHQSANDFYAANRAAMDAGCKVSWYHCYDEENELSAIQHAYNVLIDDGPEVVASELQNSPMRESLATTVLSEAELLKKLNNYERGVVPPDVVKLTAFGDVQKEGVFWIVCGWAENFTGYVLDYGVWPEQSRSRFSKRDLRPGLSDAYPDGGLEGRLFAGLKDCSDFLQGYGWHKSGGEKMHLARLAYDANWGDSTDTVYSYIHQSPHNGMLPSHGQFIGAASRTLNYSAKKIGEERGLNWRIPPLEKGRLSRHLLFDTNFWKSFVFKRFATAQGAAGALTLFRPERPNQHELFVEHLVAESPTQVIAKGRTVDEWRIRPSRPDNDWFDALVGAAVLASVEGINLIDHKQRHNAPKKRARFSFL